MLEPLTQVHTLSDADVAAATLRDSRAFAEVVVRYEEKLTRYIRRLGVRNVEDGEDVLQEIFIKVYKNLNAYDSSLAFSSWIYRIAHNEAISFYRKQAVRPEGHQLTDSTDVLTWLPDDGMAPADRLFDVTVNAQVVQGALATLDPKYRDALILRYFEHKEYDEISDILKIPIGSVGTLIHRGKQQLGQHISPQHVAI